MTTARTRKQAVPKLYWQLIEAAIMSAVFALIGLSAVEGDLLDDPQGFFFVLALGLYPLLSLICGYAGRWLRVQLADPVWWTDARNTNFAQAGLISLLMAACVAAPQVDALSLSAVIKWLICGATFYVPAFILCELVDIALVFLGRRLGLRGRNG